MKDVYAINRIHFAKRVESDNVSPTLFFFLTLRPRTNKVKVIPAVLDRGELTRSRQATTSLEVQRTAQ